MTKINDPAISTIDALTLMADGNPGAITVLVSLLTVSPSSILYLDELEMYGPDIWVLYKDECDEDLDRTVATIHERWKAKK